MDIKNILDWLNRSGLLLGLISTMLLSPQLIGIDRLKRWEQKLTRTLHTVEGLSFYYRTRLILFYRRYKSIVSAFALMLLLQAATLSYVRLNPLKREGDTELLLIILPLAALCVGWYAGSRMAKAHPGRSKWWDNIKWIGIGAFCFTFAIPITILLLSFFILVLLSIVLLSSLRELAGWINEKLEGAWLFRLITSLGILMLFASFFFQLIATFK